MDAPSHHDDSCQPKLAPEGWPEVVKTAASVVSDVVRFSLIVGALPAMALPQVLRSAASRGIRTAVEASGIVPHAIARGLDVFADDLAGAEE